VRANASARRIGEAGAAPHPLGSDGNVEQRSPGRPRYWRAAYSSPFIAQANLEAAKMVRVLRDGRSDLGAAADRDSGRRSCQTSAPQRCGDHHPYDRDGGCLGRATDDGLHGRSGMEIQRDRRAGQLLWNRQDDNPARLSIATPDYLFKGSGAEGRVTAWPRSHVSSDEGGTVRPTARPEPPRSLRESCLISSSAHR